MDRFATIIVRIMTPVEVDLAEENSVLFLLQRDPVRQRFGVRLRRIK